MKRFTQSRAMQKAKDSDRQRFASVWDAIEDTPEDAAMMKALSAESLRQEAAGVQDSDQAKWSRENFAKDLAQNNQTAPMGTSIIGLRRALYPSAEPATAFQPSPRAWFSFGWFWGWIWASCLQIA